MYVFFSNRNEATKAAWIVMATVIHIVKHQHADLRVIGH